MLPSKSNSTLAKALFLYRNSALEVLQVVAAITLRARFSCTADYSQAELARPANLFPM
jgi:hypothetical protein